jgi:type IV secretory pathway TrbD component
MSNDVGPVVLRAVAAPPSLLYASPKLVMAEAGICLGIWLFLLEPLAAIVAFLLLHGVAVVLTRRDPHLVEVYQAGFRCKRTRNLRPARGNRYVP